MGKQGRRLAIGGALALVAAGGSAAQAMTLAPGWELLDRPGSRALTIDPGVTGIRFVALSGNGGGVRGGRGAVVAGEFPVAAGQLVRLKVGSEGDAVRTGLPDGTTSAGRGGDLSSVSVCRTTNVGLCTVGATAQPVAVAGGGGGSGGGSPLFPGGAGGDAGAPGADGVEGPRPGAGGRGGAPAPLATGGARGIVPAGCMSGQFGVDGKPGNGTLGGIGGGFSTDASLEGGTGGDGVAGGGGGGSAATCQGDQAGGSGGGAGGTSLVPAGGTLGLREPGPAIAAPSIRYFLVRETTAPTVTVSAPVDGGRYVARTAVAAAYSCVDEAAGSGLESCVGTVASGQAIDTGTPGVKTFTVTARDRFGNTTSTTVRYTVVAPPVVAPKVSGVGGSARAVRFTLSSPARVTLRVERRKPGRRVRWARFGTLNVAGRSGANTVALRGRVGRRRLTPGRYRVVIVASTAGRRSKPVTATFNVRPRRR